MWLFAALATLCNENYDFIRHHIPYNALPGVGSLSVAMARAFSSWSSQWSCSSLRVEARSWPSTSAALFLLVTTRRSRSAASLIFSSRWISCLSRARASSRCCWNTGSSKSPSGRPRKHPLYKNVLYGKIIDSYIWYVEFARCPSFKFRNLSHLKSNYWSSSVQSCSPGGMDGWRRSFSITTVTWANCHEFLSCELMYTENHR